MKAKLTKLFTTLALAAGFASAAWATAPTPVAVWDGDFTGADESAGAAYGSFSLKANGNTLADDKDKITISQDNGVLIDWDSSLQTATTANGGFADRNITILVRYSNMACASKFTCLGTVWASDSDSAHYDFVGVMADSTGAGTPRKAYGINNSESWTGTAQTQQQIPAASQNTYTMAIVYNPSSRGTECFISTDGSTYAKYYGSTSLMTASASYILRGAAIGGVRVATLPTTNPVYGMTGLNIEKVAVFNTALTADDMTAFKFASEGGPAVYGAKWGNIGTSADDPGICDGQTNGGKYKSITFNFGAGDNVTQKGIGGFGRVRITKMRLVRRHGYTDGAPSTVTLTQGSKSIQSTATTTTANQTIWWANGTANTEAIYDITFNSDVMFDASKNIVATFADSQLYVVKPCNSIAQFTGSWSPAFEIQGDWAPTRVVNYSVAQCWGGSTKGLLEGDSYATMLGDIPLAAWSQPVTDASDTTARSDSHGSTLTISKYWDGLVARTFSGVIGFTVASYISGGTNLYSPGTDDEAASKTPVTTFTDFRTAVNQALNCSDTKSPNDTITVSGIPFAHYDAIVYFAGGNKKGTPYTMNAVQVNGGSYYKPNSTTPGDNTVSAGSSAWGNSTTSNLVYGTNVMRINGLSGSSLTLGQRCEAYGIAAVQVVERIDATATIPSGANLAWVNIPWTDGAPAADEVATLTLEGDATITVDAAAACSAIAVKGTGTLTLDAGDNLTCAKIVSAIPLVLTTAKNQAVDAGANNLVYNYTGAAMTDTVPSVTCTGNLTFGGTSELKWTAGVASGKTLTVAGTCTLNYAGSGKSVSGTVTVNAGATFVAKNSDMLNYDGSPILKIYGTYEGGTTRQNFSDDCQLYLYSGCVVNGEGDGAGTFDFFEASTITAGGSKYGRVVVNCPIKLRDSGETQTIDVNDNTHVEIHGAVIGAGNLAKTTSGDSTLALYGANTFTGSLTVDKGYLALMPGSSYACSGITASSGTALELGGTKFSSYVAAPASSAQVVVPCGIENNARIDVYGDSKVAGAVTGSGALNGMAKGETLTLAGAYSATGTIKIPSGSALTVDGTCTAKTADFDGAITVGDAGTLTISGSANDANNTLRLDIYGNLVLNTRFTFNGGATVNLYAGANITGTGDAHGAIDAASTDCTIHVLDSDSEDKAVGIGATWRLRSWNMSNNTIDIAEGVTVNVTGQMGYNSTNADSNGNLIKTGLGTLTIGGTAAKNIGGDITVNGGSLVCTVQPFRSGVGKTLTMASSTKLDVSGFADASIDKLTLNSGSTIKVPANFTVGTTFTSSGYYHIDGSAVLTDTAEHTLITVPSTTPPELTGVTVNGSDDKVWDLAAEAGCIKATYTERTEVHYDSASGKWVDADGNETAISSTTIVRFNDGDDLTFTSDVTPYAIAFSENAAVSVTGQSHLKGTQIEIPEGCELILKSNEALGVDTVLGAGTLTVKVGTATKFNAQNNLPASKFSGFGGTIKIAEGRVAELTTAYPANVAIEIVDGGQLWMNKATTWAGRITASGNGWTGDPNTPAAGQAPIRIGAAVTVSGTLTLVDGTSISAWENTLTVSGKIVADDGFTLKGNGGTVKLTTIADDEIGGTVTLTGGDLWYGTGSGGVAGSSYKCGDTIVVNSGRTFNLHPWTTTKTGSAESDKVILASDIDLQGGTVHIQDGSYVFSGDVTVSADSKIDFYWAKGRIFKSLKGGSGKTLTLQSANNDTDVGWCYVTGGDFAGTLKLTGSGTGCYLVPYASALANAAVQPESGSWYVCLTQDATLGALDGSLYSVFGDGSKHTLTLKGGSYSGVLKDQANGTPDETKALSVVIAGDVTLSGANTFTGGLTVEGGTLTVNAAAALGDGTVTVEDGAAIDFGSVRDVTKTFAGTGTLKFTLTDAEIAAGEPLTLVTCAGLTNTIEARDGFGRKYTVKVAEGVYTVESFTVATDLLSVNVVSAWSGHAGGEIDAGPAGAIPVAVANWNQYSVGADGASFTTSFAGAAVKELLANGTIDKGAMKVTLSAKNAYTSGKSAVSGDGQLTTAYLDDGSYDSHAAQIIVENIPYSEYTVIVYFGSDSNSGNDLFKPITVNDTQYPSANWGARSSTWETDGIITWTEQGNYLRITGLTDSTATINGTVGADSVRCGIAGIQIVNTGTRTLSYTAPYSASATDNADALDLVWTDSSTPAKNVALSAVTASDQNQLTVASGKTVTFDISLSKAIGPGTFKKTGDGSVTMAQTGTKPAGIEVAGGTLTLGNAVKFINGASDNTAFPLTVSGGTLNLNGAYTWNNDGSGWLGNGLVTLGGGATITGGDFTFYSGDTVATLNAIKYDGGDGANEPATFAADIDGFYTTRKRYMNVTVEDGAGTDYDLLVSGDFGVTAKRYEGATAVKKGAGTVKMTGTFRMPGLTVEAGTWKVGAANAVAKTTTVGEDGTLDLNGQTVTIDTLARAGTISNSSATPAVITNTCGGVFTGTIDGDVQIVVVAGKLDVSEATLGANVTFAYDMANAAAGCGIQLPNYSGKTVEAIGTSDKYQIGENGLVERKTAMATLQDTLVWLPIGDSITEGEADMGHPGEGTKETRGGYRYQLWSQLEAAGQETRSVGYRAGHGGGGTGRVEDDDCRWAWHAAQYGGVIACDNNSGSHGAAIFNVENTLETAGYPDIITVLLGVNDLSFTDNTYAGATNVFNSLDAMVCKLAAQRPNSKILVSTLLAAGGSRAYIGRFNEILQAKSAANESPFNLANVTLIDNSSALDPAQTKDQLHPNEIGAVKVAASFSDYMAAAIESITNETAKMVSVHNGETTNVTVRFSKALAAGATAKVTLAGTDVNGNAANLVLTNGTVSAADARMMTFAVPEDMSLTSGVYTATLSEVSGTAKDTTAIDVGPLAADFVRIVGTGAAANVKSDFLTGFQRYQTVTLTDGTITSGIGTGDNWSGNGPAEDQIESGDLRSHYIKRVGYYVELKREGEPARFVWVSMNAFDNNIVKAGIPTASAGAHKAMVTNLQVYANIAGLTNTAITADGIDTNATGIVEFTPWGWSGTDVAGYTNDMYSGKTGWNDTLSGSTLAGVMQVARYTGEANPDHFTKFAAEMLFSFNNFNRATATDIGFGSFAVNRKNDGTSIGSTWDWSNFVSDTQYKKYAVNAYEVKKIEIWAEADPAYVYTADVGAGATWSKLTWKNAAGEPAAELPAGAELILNAVAENATLTLDADFTAGLFGVQSGAGTNLVITKAAEVTVTVSSIDLTYANGPVALWDTGLTPITVGGGNVVVAGGMTKTAEGYVSTDGAVTNKSGVLKIKDSDLANVVLAANQKIEFYGTNTVAAASVGSGTSWTVKDGTTELKYALDGNVTILRYTSYAVEEGATLVCPKIYASWNWGGMRIDGLMKVADEFARPMNSTATLESDTGVLQANTFGWGNNSTWTIALKEMDLGTGGIVCRNSNYAYLKFGGNMTVGALADWSTTSAFGLLSGITIDTENATNATATAQTVELKGVVSGDYGITKTGLGTLKLNAANTFTGGVIVSNGTVIVANAAGLGTGAPTLAGGSLELTADVTVSAISATAAGTVTVAEGKKLTVTGDVTGGDKITLAGAGQTVFKSYRGAVGVSGGTKAGYTVNVNDVGAFAIPAGMTAAQIRLYRADGTEITDVTEEDGKLVYEWEYTGTAAWLEYEFTTNLFNTGSADKTPLQFDGKHCFDGNEYAMTVVTQEVGGVETAITNRSIKAASAPWRDVTFPSEVTVVMYGKMMKTSKATQIGIGSTTGGSMYSLFLAAGDVSKEEVVLGYAYYNDTSEEACVREHGTLATMSVPNAQTTDHLYAFTMQKAGDDTVVNIYLDGEVLQPYTFTNQTVTLGSGIQLGSIHGGIGNSQNWPDAFGFKRSTDVETDATLDFLRVYDAVLNEAAMKKMADDYPYISPNGTFSRTLSSSPQNWEAVGAWKNEGTKATTNTPAAGSTLELTATASSRLKVNLNADVTYESLRICQNSAGAYVRITTNDAAQLGKAYVTGRLTVGAATYVNPLALDLAGTPVTVEANQTLGFDMSGYDMNKFYADEYIDLTGVVTTNAGAVIGIAYVPQNPLAAGRIWSFVKNGQTQHYGFQVYVEGAVTGTVAGSGSWSDSVTWKMGESVIVEPDWSILKDADLTIPAGEYAVTFDADRAFTNLTVTGAGTCTFRAADGVAVSARTLDVSGAAGFTLGTTGIVVTEELTLGDTLKVAYDGAKHGDVIMHAPASTDVSGVAVTVNGDEGWTLLNDGGALTLYKPNPTVFTVTGITEKPSTNFNGSTITVSYSAYEKGDYDNVTVKVTVGGHDYYYDAALLEAAGGSFDIRVANDYARAGTVTNALVTVVGSGTIKPGAADYEAYGNVKALYQGARAAATTNGWFSTWAEDTAVVADPVGAWGDHEPEAKDSRILIDEDSDGVYRDYVFTPTAQAGQVVVVDNEIAFDAALDEVTADDCSAAQAAFRIVTVGEDDYRFAALTNGVWMTNMAVTAYLTTNYPIRTTLDYRTVPSVVTYEVVTNGVRALIARGLSRTDKSAFTRVTFNGSGKLTRMTGSNCVDSVDASLVADEDGNKYADIGAALGHDGLKLLWDATWKPTAIPDSFDLAANGHDLYYTPGVEGVRVVKNGDNYEITGNYFEAMNVLFTDDGISTNKYTYFTNAVALTGEEIALTGEAGESITNLYLLRDVALDKALAVSKTMALWGETNELAGTGGIAIADGKTLTIGSGFIGIAEVTGGGAVSLEGGRYTADSKEALADCVASDHAFGVLEVVAKEGYTWQVVAGDEPTGDEMVLPVNDAAGNDAGSIVLSDGWLEEKGVTGTAEEKVDQLNVPQENNLTKWENLVLGITEPTEGNIPVITAQQSAKSDVVTFTLSNVTVDPDSGARVKYCVKTFASPNATVPEAISSEADPDASIEIPLPELGVRYYRIEVNATSK